MAKKVLFNLSGHPLPETPKGYQIVDIQVPNFDLNNAEVVINAVKTLISPIYKDYLDSLMKGEYEIVFMGMSVLTVVAVAILHGLSGHFPIMRWTYKTDAGFTLSKPLDVQKIRIDSRDARFFGRLP
jgi:hypothetical protein